MKTLGQTGTAGRAAGLLGKPCLLCREGHTWEELQDPAALATPGKLPPPGTALQRGGNSRWTAEHRGEGKRRNRTQGAEAKTESSQAALVGAAGSREALLCPRASWAPAGTAPAHTAHRAGHSPGTCDSCSWLLPAIKTPVPRPPL